MSTEQRNLRSAFGIEDRVARRRALTANPLLRARVHHDLNWPTTTCVSHATLTAVVRGLVLCTERDEAVLQALRTAEDDLAFQIVLGKLIRRAVGEVLRPRRPPVVSEVARPQTPLTLTEELVATAFAHGIAEHVSRRINEVNAALAAFVAGE